MTLFLTDKTMREIGVALGERFTTGELDELGDLLREAATYSNERADAYLELVGDEGEDDTEQEEMAQTARLVAADLTKMADAIEAGEKLGREDH